MRTIVQIDYISYVVLKTVMGRLLNIVHSNITPSEEVHVRASVTVEQVGTYLIDCVLDFQGFPSDELS